MITEKQKILEKVNTLPETTNSEDTLYNSYIYSKLIKSENDIKNGKVITLEELDKEMEKLPL